MPSADRLNVQKAGICAGARRLRLLFVTGFPVSPRPRLVEFTVPRSTGKSPKTVSRQPTPPPRQPALGTPRWRPGLDETIPDGLRREIREETGLDIEPDALTGVYKNMPRGIIALVFRCKITGGHLATNDEVTTFHWADQNDIRQLTSEAYAIRLLDALREDTTPAVRQHDGTKPLS